MLRFLHAADVHLDSPLVGLERYEGAPVEEIRGAARRSLASLIDLALAEEVDFVLLAGDLYDGDWKDYNTGLFFLKQAARLADAGIALFLITGNHDADSQITKSLHLTGGAHLFPTARPGTRVLEALGVAIHGQGFARREVSVDLSAGYPPPLPGLFNIGLLHTSLDGRPGHAAYAPTTAAKLATRGYQYWALGHVHAREVVAEEPWIVFPGNLQGRHARETGAKGAYLVTVGDDFRAALEFRATDVLRWAVCTVDLAGVEALPAALERARDALEGAVAAADGRPLAARLRLAGACALDGALRADPERFTQEFRALGNAFLDPGVWIEKVALDTRPAADSRAAAEAEDLLAGLAAAAARLAASPEELAALAGEAAAALRTKLPADWLASAEGVDPTAPQLLAAALAEARDLLLARLGGADGG